MKYLLFVLLALILIGCKRSPKEPGTTEWIQLFNGKDLNDWTIKFTGHELNENYRNTFRVEDGILKVSYDEYESFDAIFGHIFYKDPFSHYILRIEYRFTGDQVPGGPQWAYKNNGAMLHSQAPETMDFDQDFPVSIEAQLLGGAGEGERPTANLCTPGTHVVMNNELVTQHCIGSRSKTYHGNEWVTVELHVRGNDVIHHIIDGDTVLTYYTPQVGGSNKPKNYPLPDGTLLSEGFIALQAESHPTEFRVVELLDLSQEYVP